MGAIWYAPVYIIACLFCYLYRAKAKLSYLRLSKKELGKLVTLITDVTIAFSVNGIYYAIQMAAGARIFDEDRGQPISYADFSEKLDEPGEHAWFELMLKSFVSLGEGYDVRDEHLALMLSAVQKLCEHLDRVIGDCFFLEARKKGDCEHIYPDGSRRTR